MQRPCLNPISLFILEGVGLPCQHLLQVLGLGGARCFLLASPIPRWALWFFKNDRSRAWQDNLHLVTKFDTVEDFWA